ncbi:MAG: hypothetical protein ABJG68_09795 [Crocinitomicaceae bacterium]
MAGARDYKESDIKRLFAFSGNQCAHPHCERMMIGEDQITVVGKVCHIEAASKKGPRFNISMNDDQRRDFENLILMCDEHHSIIDNPKNEGKFPKELIKEWKTEHQRKNISKAIDIDDKLVREAINSISNSIINSTEIVNSGNNNRTEIHNYFNEHHNDSEDFSIVQEIFEHAIKMASISPHTKEVDDGKLIHILEKIHLNFTSKEDIKEVREYFTRSINKKNAIERFLKDLDSETQLDLEGHISMKYNELKGQMPNIDILRELFQLFIPKGKEKMPDYSNTARAFVLLFFEDCTIYEKTASEKSTNKDLFSDL